MTNEKDQNSKMDFMALIHKDISDMVDQSAEYLKNRLYKLVDRKVKQSWMNGIEAGKKKTGQGKEEKASSQNAKTTQVEN
jgi:hypothetical protein